MAERYSFFDAKQTSDNAYDRVYNSADVARYFSSFVGNGVYANPANSLKVYSSSGMKVKVTTGKAWINGYFYELYDSDMELSLTVGDNTYTRNDIVVLRLNLIDRVIQLKVIQGTPGGATPKLVRDDSYYDLELAQISVAPGATKLTDASIIDTRSDNSVCGFVAQVVDEIDTTKLFSQYDSEFNEWFDSVKNLTDTNDNTKLASQVTALTEKNKKYDDYIPTIYKSIWSQYTSDFKVADGETKTVSVNLINPLRNDSRIKRPPVICIAGISSRNAPSVFPHELFASINVQIECLDKAKATLYVKNNSGKEFYGNLLILGYNPFFYSDDAYFSY